MDRNGHAHEQRPHNQLYHPANGTDLHPIFPVFGAVLSGGHRAFISTRGCRRCGRCSVVPVRAYRLWGGLVSTRSLSLPRGLEFATTLVDGEHESGTKVNTFGRELRFQKKQHTSALPGGRHGRGRASRCRRPPPERILTLPLRVAFPARVPWKSVAAPANK